MDLELWPQFSDFARFLCAFALKISGPNRPAKITDHFTCISVNVIYCITCTLCEKIYIGEIGRRLADRFREHLGDVGRNDTDASKPVVRHFNLPNYSHHNMTICYEQRISSVKSGIMSRSTER